MKVQVQWRLLWLVEAVEADTGQTVKVLVESRLCGQKLSCSYISHATPYVHAVQPENISRPQQIQWCSRWWRNMDSNYHLERNSQPKFN